MDADVTRSVDAAAWFASHYWNGNVVEKTSSGRVVSYRFIYDAINAVLKKGIVRRETIHQEFEKRGPHSSIPQPLPAYYHACLACSLTFACFRHASRRGPSIRVIPIIFACWSVSSLNIAVVTKNALSRWPCSCTNSTT